MKGRRTPFVAQMEETECGAASLAMVLGHFGHHASLAELREACGVSRDGASAAALVRAARERGLEAAAHRVEPEDLSEGPFPAILHWEFNHFVVLTEVSRRGLHLLDPAVGPRVVSPARADEAFTGVRLTFSPGPGFRRRSRPATSSRYLGAVRRAAGPLALATLAALALEALGLALPVASQVAIDYAVRPRQARFLLALGAALAAAALLRFVLALARNRVLAGLRAALDTWMVSAFVGHLVGLPLAFFGPRSAGDLAARALGHAAVRNAVRDLSVAALGALLVVAYAALMLAYDVGLGALVVGLTALRVAATALWQARARDPATNEVIALAREASVVAESFSSPEAIKAFGVEANMARRYADCSTDRFNAALARERVERNVVRLQPWFDALVLAAVYGVGGWRVASGRMTLGVLASFVTVSTLLADPLRQVVEAAAGVPRLRQLLRRMDDLWDTAPEPRGARRPGDVAGAIALRGVALRHARGARPVLEGVDLEIAAGERVAVVGPSGSGKSTLAMVLCGLIPPTAGRVLLDGEDLAGLDPAEVRARVAFVPPEAGHFDGTVRENVALGDAERPLADVEAAARMACVDAELRALPGGYDARVDGRGLTLSGGQRQRLALARAFLRAPRVVVLDEATSSLDPALEARVFANLAGAGCTQVVVTHRPPAMRLADRIVVLSAGRVVDQGTYDALLGRCELFRALMRAHGEAAL
ncbi:MAG TPA: cysteine peptidase family C39 domain-containing protein [Polyangiaceae bacterium]|nr:cysteine peptidase family C39 domain-containing protein [Polyangiaceae bacterium]